MLLPSKASQIVSVSLEIELWGKKKKSITIQSEGNLNVFWITLQCHTIEYSDTLLRIATSQYPKHL